MRGDESDSDSGKMDESSVRTSLDALCQELNMDEETATEAMQNFTAIWNTYTLEVSRTHILMQLQLLVLLISKSIYMCSVFCGRAW